jgi:hypothetical protein
MMKPERSAPAATVALGKANDPVADESVVTVYEIDE